MPSRGVPSLRTACLEESVASVLALALIGRGVRWCHSVKTDPIVLALPTKETNT